MSVRILHYSDLETALDTPARTGALAGAIEARRDEQTVVVGTGDNTAPGALSLVTEGRAALAVFEELDPDADTFGNHDFDFGPESARQLAADAPQPWLCANARANGGRFAAEATRPSRLVETATATVGLVGVAHPKTGSINPAASDIEFVDPVPVVREEATRLRERGAEHVAVVSHCGRLDERIARETDVAAVLGGHVHDVHTDTVEGTVVVRPGRAARHFSELTLGDSPSVTVHDVDGTVDDRLADRLSTQLADHGLDEVVTTVEHPIERTERAVNTAGSQIGNFVTDALRWKAQTDVALSPPGGIRAGDPLEGEVTVGDLMGLTPYSDDLVTVELPGHRLREAFVAVPFGYHDEGHPDRLCTHVSGASLVWDDDAGQLREASVGGEPVDPGERYTVAVADYLVETDFVNPAFGTEDVTDSHGVACHALVEYAREAGIDPPTRRRVERPTLW